MDMDWKFTTTGRTGAIVVVLSINSAKRKTKQVAAAAAAAERVLMCNERLRASQHVNSIQLAVLRGSPFCQLLIGRVSLQ